MMRAESRGKGRAGSSVNSQTNSQLNAGINIQTKYFTAGRSGSRRSFVLLVLAAVFYLFLNLVTAVSWGSSGSGRRAAGPGRLRPERRAALQG
jgi:hypothetical protein